jgi:hypothetical protein
MVRHVSEIGDLGVVVREDCGRERLDLAERNGRPAERMPGNGGGFDT